MKKMMKLIALAAMVLMFTGIFVMPAAAVQFEFHGDMNHRFLLGTNHNEFISSLDKYDGVINKDGVDDNFAEIKYRFWFEAASDDNSYKGVFATEIGGLRFGEKSKLDYSGDDIRMEVRWAYFDFQLPFAEQKSRVRMGLQPININRFLWKETVGGVKWYGNQCGYGYELGWLRGYEADVTKDDNEDLMNDQDALYGKLNIKPADGMGLGFLGIYQWNNIDDEDPAQANNTLSPHNYEFKKFANDTNIDIQLFTLGVDGSFKRDAFFAKWDLMYQTGSLDQLIYQDLDLNSNPIDDYDVDAWFVHADLGINMGKCTLTYTGWYASGDDDPYDDDLEAFMATDVDIADSAVIFEGNLVDDNYFTERPYIMDRGFIMNKLNLDYKATSKLKLSLAGMYMLTAEDLEYHTPDGTQVSEDEIGFEVDARASYKLFKNVKMDLCFGYLFAGDAMDYFEVDEIQDGDSDEDIWISSMRIRYKF
ncbi:MAG: hypothetical protein U9N77_12860 [Thermodesulfobacteriota bacterium]|nr:hypothetical protein [Thermodesulfobacteriota bacterium]